jgi:hypothetical protein
MKVCIKRHDKEINDGQIEVITSFIKFLQSQLPLSSDIIIILTNDQETTGTTGVRKPGSKIFILTKKRMLVDILRTLSHEWVHEFQYQKMGLDDNAKIQDIGGSEENMSNVLSGIFIKKFNKQNPNYTEIVYEQSLVKEVSLNSNDSKDIIKIIKDKPEILKHLGFRDLGSVKHYIKGVNQEDLNELRNDIQDFLDERKKYFEKEMDEFERAAQDLSRNEEMDVSVDEIISAFNNAKETTLTKDVWSKLENTESNQIKKGEIGKVKELAKKYNKSNPMDLKYALESGDYSRPMILKYGDRYHLVAGNTRLCTAAAMGIKPQVLVGEI